MMMKSLATTSVALFLVAPLAAEAGPPVPVPVQVTNPVVPVEVRNADPISVSGTVETQDRYSPGRTAKRYGPSELSQGGSSGFPLTGLAIVPAVASGETFIVTNVLVALISNISSVPLVEGVCALLLGTPTGLQALAVIPLTRNSLPPEFGGDLQLLFPLSAGERLNVSCFGVAANGTQVSQTLRATVTGYTVPTS